MRLTSILMLVAALRGSAQSTAIFEWKGPIQPRQTLEIRNVNGDIRAEAATGSDVELSVQIIGTRPDPRTIKIDVVQHDGGILLCTIYQGLSQPEYCGPQQTPSVTLNNSDIRVIYTVKVPATATFTPRAVNGNISADLPDSPVSAATVNGRIVLDTNMSTEAHVVNGSIVATLGNIDWTGEREFAAVNGAIDLAIPEGAQATVRANSVLGYLSNDFGIPVHRSIVSSWYSGDINGGGPGLALGTVIGSIHLRRIPAAVQ